MGPLVTIGMPVYNEEKFLSATIRSILEQDYSNIELIISDNASSDTTENICKNWCKKDKRVKYIRNKKNIGAIKNFYQVSENAKGEYFMFAGGHDRWSRNYISECLNVLEKSQASVLAFPSIRWIDKNGLELNKDTPFYDTRGCDPIIRFFHVLWGPMTPIYGLIRTDKLKEVRLDLEIIGADLIILTELCFIGPFTYVPDAIWYRRSQLGQESRKQRVQRYNKQLFEKGSLFSKLFPNLKIPFELLKSILNAEFNLADKAAILSLCILSMPFRYYVYRK
ncbi:MAG: glycosyltransferase family 2 protein [Desulfobacter sp.]|nr:MAG: glycosyltransferase family 2 protein [Desulfobacter sp.]